jgi:hypothetical protein
VFVIFLHYFNRIFRRLFFKISRFFCLIIHSFFSCQDSKANEEPPNTFNPLRQPKSNFISYNNNNINNSDSIMPQQSAAIQEKMRLFELQQQQQQQQMNNRPSSQDINNMHGLIANNNSEESRVR